MGFFAHAQTVDTRPLFPPPTWPGYKANRENKVFCYHYNGTHSAIHNLGVVHACNCVPVSIVGGGVVGGGVVVGGVVGGGVVVGGVVGGGVVGGVVGGGVVSGGAVGGVVGGSVAGGNVVAVRGRTRKREME